MEIEVSKSLVHCASIIVTFFQFWTQVFQNSLPGYNNGDHCFPPMILTFKMATVILLVYGEFLCNPIP